MNNANPIILSTWLIPFVSRVQRSVMVQNARGEEGQFFIDKMEELKNLFVTMPKTYEQDGKGKDAIAYLHYFKNGCDWYITERDMEQEQLQAFGLACLNGDYPEIGYISIVELLSVGAELDLYWTPKTIKEIEKEING